MTQAYTPEGYVMTMAYDAENRMKSAEFTDSGSVQRKTEYVWSGDNLLAEMKKYQNGALTQDTRYIRAGFLPIQERDAANAITREYTWGLNLGGGIGGLLNLRQSGQDYAYLYDGKGNVSALIDGAQAVAAAYAYDPFGVLVRKAGTLDQRYQFSTKEYDAETGAIYYGYRFYNPILAKWTTKDLLEEAGGVNLYGFVGNNPVNWVDQLGLTTLLYQHYNKELLVFDKDDKLVGMFPASNNPDSKSNGPFPSGTFNFWEYNPHTGDGPDDTFGSNGNFMFDVPGRDYMGVHSGHANSCDKAKRCGENYATMGCIRTTDEATALIKKLHLNGDPVKNITVYR